MIIKLVLGLFILTIYALIGGIVNGISQDKFEPNIVLLWPLRLLTIYLLGFGEFIYRLVRRIRKMLWGY